ncbi:putative transmembrane protein [Toxoplasma gondii VAND]|uniref:Putative transmembrane protein n=1 Tax=Toxoplasma gondii VAND TaxID=933077 RepID=A0A086Q786_TOXGO|nr:putative transmembrane protein [Toxoplasma gondii VAND]
MLWKRGVDICEKHRLRDSSDASICLFLPRSLFRNRKRPKKPSSSRCLCLRGKESLHLAPSSSDCFRGVSLLASCRQATQTPDSVRRESRSPSPTWLCLPSVPYAASCSAARHSCVERPAGVGFPPAVLLTLTRRPGGLRRQSGRREGTRGRRRLRGPEIFPLLFRVGASDVLLAGAPPRREKPYRLPTDSCAAGGRRRATSPQAKKNKETLGCLGCRTACTGPARTQETRRAKKERKREKRESIFGVSSGDTRHRSELLRSTDSKGEKGFALFALKIFFPLLSLAVSVSIVVRLFPHARHAARSTRLAQSPRVGASLVCVPSLAKPEMRPRAFLPHFKRPFGSVNSRISVMPEGPSRTPPFFCRRALCEGTFSPRSALLKCIVSSLAFPSLKPRRRYAPREVFGLFDLRPSAELNRVTHQASKVKMFEDAIAFPQEASVCTETVLDPRRGVRVSS